MIFKSRFLRRTALIAAPIVAIAAGGIVYATTAGAQSQAVDLFAGQYTDGRYIVTFADSPVATYTGYDKNFAATKPAQGEKIDRNAAKVKGWQKHLTDKHDAALRSVGASKLYDYTVTNNAVAADLTAVQAARLAKTPGVFAVSKDKMYKVDTTDTPHFLGLDAPGGLWAQQGGQGDAGRGVVVGLLDTGIWPESDSFKYTGVQGKPRGWSGECVGGEDNSFPVSSCPAPGKAGKLIGARYYVDGFGRDDISDEEFLSPRDGAGHGSHTASTAAGNANVAVSIDGVPQGTASGMAPAAFVAMYKVCWAAPDPDDDGCAGADMLAALNDAILDGVDVINFSIGSTVESDPFDALEFGFLVAEDAGVFVSASAGNSGPGASTLDHPSPWLTTVAATTFRKAFNTVELGDGSRFVGASTTSTLPTQTPLINGSAAALAAFVGTQEASWCANGTLDPALVAGKVVVCVRGGVIPRIESSAEVKAKGGVGMILRNANANQSLNGDYHFVPTVHVGSAAGSTISTYAGTAGATAAIVAPTQAEFDAQPNPPAVASFSSRGPSTTTGGDILKPDISAPGVDVVAAVAPPSNFGRSFDYYSGTSMAAPHIAGIAANLKRLHPEWTPSMIKSALMTSAGDTVGTTDVFAQGAGFVNANTATDPGLVYPTTTTEYLQYLVSLGVTFAPPFDTLTPISGSQLNSPSIAVGQLAGTTTITRRVMNVAKQAATYSLSGSVPGFTVEFLNANDQPITSLTVGKGAEASFKIRFTRTTAALNAYAKGSMILTSGSHVVRSPIALRPVALAAPPTVSAAVSASGSTSWTVTPGATLTLDTQARGIAAGVDQTGTVAVGDLNVVGGQIVPDADTIEFDFVLPSSSRAYRWVLDGPDDGDLDMFVFLETGFVGQSATSAADESFTVVGTLAAGRTFRVFVNGFRTADGNPAAFTLTSYIVPLAETPAFTVTDNIPATAGTPVTVTATWTGLDPTKKYFTLVEYPQVTGARTFITLG